MPKCPICGTEHDSAFCPSCGIKAENQQPEPATNPAPPVTKDAPLGMWDYFLMELVRHVPLVNIIFYFIWGFSSGSNTNRKNWSRAQLIWACISLVFSIISIALFVMTAVFGLTALGESGVFEIFHELEF